MYVKGDDPRYLAIPGRDDILFITSNEPETEFIYHFVSLKDGKEIAITVHYTSLWLGFGSPAETKGQISFEAVDGRRIVILWKLTDGWYRYSFDLDKKTAVVDHG